MIDLYAAEEPRLQVLEEARSWATAGLIAPAQLQAIEGVYAPRLVRVNLFFRLLLAGFALLAVGASVGLLGLVLRAQEVGLALCLLVGASVSALLADRWLIDEKRLYRCGAEETLLAKAVSLAATAAWLLASEIFPSSPTAALRWSTVVFLAGASTGAWRYGNPLPALAAVFALAALPFELLAPDSVSAARLVVAVLLAPMAAGSHWLLDRARAGSPDLLPGYRQCLESVRWASLALLYLDVNAYVDRMSSLGGGFRGFTSGASPGSSGRIWLCAFLTAALPAAALWLGIRRRDRSLLWFGGASAVASLLTLKYFFHLGHLAEELTTAGAALAGGAFLLLRWLRAGPNRERGGFTAERLLDPRLYGFDLEALAALQPLAPGPAQASGASTGLHPGGGEFGGGGASGGYG